MILAQRVERDEHIGNYPARIRRAVYPAVAIHDDHVEYGDDVGNPLNRDMLPVVDINDKPAVNKKHHILVIIYIKIIHTMIRGLHDKLFSLKVLKRN